MVPSSPAGTPVELHYEQWPGTLGPASGTPDRRPGSVRRTTSVQSTWPEGFRGPLVLVCTGRDLLTPAAGAPTAIDAVHLEIATEAGSRVVRSGPVSVIGADLGGGFRRAAASAAGAGTVLAMLLDDVPAAALVSGASPIQAAVEATGRLPFAPQVQDRAAVCIGWRRDGAMARGLLDGRPFLGQGPAAGTLEREDDPLAWHDEPSLAVYGMRRRRRTDVWLAGADLRVDSYFRDSRVGPDGMETSVHEYEVLAAASAADLVLRHVEVRPRVLPGPECPGAVPSAQAVVGLALQDFRRAVRLQLRGDHGCTHLTDQLRSLGDVPLLASHLG